jgi:hypothetical protein
LRVTSQNHKLTVKADHLLRFFPAKSHTVGFKKGDYDIGKLAKVWPAGRFWLALFGSVRRWQTA